MKTPTYKELLDAGVHFGHQKKKWNPKMSPYIFMERKGIHLIDVNKTITGLEKSGKALKQIAKSGRKILFVATKKQAKMHVSEAARSVGMPYVTDRWLGGMLTNFATIKKSIKKMQYISNRLNDDTATNITKKEKLMYTREHLKLDRVLGGIANINRIPSAIFIVDIEHEHIALKEATKLGINSFGIVDSNSNPSKVDYVIPANDDASKSVKIITDYITGCIKEGLDERNEERNQEKNKVKADEKSA